MEKKKKKTEKEEEDNPPFPPNPPTPSPTPTQAPQKGGKKEPGQRARKTVVQSRSGTDSNVLDISTSKREG